MVAVTLLSPGEIVPTHRPVRPLAHPIAQEAEEAKATCQLLQKNREELIDHNAALAERVRGGGRHGRLCCCWLFPAHLAG